MKNPYLRKFSQLHSNRIIVSESGREHYSEIERGKEPEESYHQYRREWAKKYAWAIPNAEAIERIVEESPIVEIGAGTGYWAWLIDQKGGDIICYDVDPPTDEEAWYDVKWGDHEKASAFPNRTLFLSWVSYNEDWGLKALKNYEGDTVIVIGEGSGGCTGDSGFHSRLAHNWKVVDSVNIPQWYGIHDYMRVYKRK